MKDIIKSCMKPWFSIYPWRDARKINVREIGVRENWMREIKMREVWSWAKIKWIKVYRWANFRSQRWKAASKQVFVWIFKTDEAIIEG